MKRIVPLITAICSALIPGHTLAAEPYLMIGFGPTFNELHQADETELSYTYKLATGIYFYDRFGIEAGAQSYPEWELDETFDASGSFQVSFERYDITFGPAFKLIKTHDSALIAKLGVTHSNTKMTVKETFFGIKPTGSVAIKDSVQGYYAALAIQFEATRDFDMQASLELIDRKNIFEPSSRRLDLRNTSFTLSLVY